MQSRASRASAVYAYTGGAPFDAAQPTVRLRPRRAQRPRRVRAAVALLRAPRHERARGRPARPRPLAAARRCASVEALADWLLRRARCGGVRESAASSAIRSARSPRSNARRAIRDRVAPARAARPGGADDGQRRAARRRGRATITSRTSSSTAGRSAPARSSAATQCPACG